MNLSIVLIIGSIVLFVIIVAVMVTIAVNKEKKILNEGIETDSTVCRIEDKWDVNNHKNYYNAYVKYVGDDNLEHEALLNVRSDFPYGRKIKIKYLPPKYDYAVFISQELEQDENMQNDIDII